MHFALKPLEWSLGVVWINCCVHLARISLAEITFDYSGEERSYEVLPTNPFAVFLPIQPHLRLRRSRGYHLFEFAVKIPTNEISQSPFEFGYMQKAKHCVREHRRLDSKRERKEYACRPNAERWYWLIEFGWNPEYHSFWVYGIKLYNSIIGLWPQWNEDVRIMMAS